MNGVRRASLWVAAIGLASISAPMIHSGLVDRYDGFALMAGTACLLSATAIYWHNLRARP